MGGGGDFMRVRVAVNITKSLCRGRKAMIKFGNLVWLQSSLQEEF